MRRTNKKKVAIIEIKTSFLLKNITVLLHRFVDNIDNPFGKPQSRDSKLRFHFFSEQMLESYLNITYYVREKWATTKIIGIPVRVVHNISLKKSNLPISSLLQ